MKIVSQMSVKLKNKSSDRLLCNPVRHHSGKAEKSNEREKPLKKVPKAFHLVAGFPALHSSRTAVLNEISNVDRFQILVAFPSP